MDPYGYLLVGTTNGINRFNSRSFAPLPYKKTGALPQGNVEDLVADNKGRLWFADFYNGLGLVNLTGAKPAPPVYYQPPVAPFDSNRLGTYVSKLAFDTHGNLWVGTRGNGLYRFDTGKRTFTLLRFNNPTSQFDGLIRSLFLYRPDTMFVGIVNGLSILNPLTREVRHVNLHYTFPTTLGPPTVRKIIHWKEDTFALATDRGAYFLHLRTGGLYKINRRPLTKELDDISCNDILKYGNDELWLATERHGVVFFNTATQAQRFSYQQKNTDEGIPEAWINAFYTDGGQNLWVCHQFGVSLLKEPGHGMSNIPLNEPDGLESGVLLTHGDCLLVFNNKNFFSFNTKTAQLQKRPLYLPPKTKPVKMVMQHQKFGYVLFCHENIVAIDTASLRVTALPVKPADSPDTLFHNFLIQACVVDTQNREEVWWLLVSGNRRGLYAYKPQTGELKMAETPGEGVGNVIARKALTAIAKDKNKGLWISTSQSGLYYFPFGPKAKTVRYRFPGRSKNASEWVSDLLYDSEGNLWCTLHGTGLVKILGQQGKVLRVKTYGLPENLDNPFLGCLLEDGAGRIWANSVSDLYCFDKQKQRFRKFTSRNGIRNARFILFEFETAVSRAGEVFYADGNNLLHFRPNELFTGTRDPKLIISGLQAADEFYNLLGIQSPLRFSARNNSVSIVYDVLDYEEVGNYVIEYKIEGFEKGWNRTALSGPLQYRQLPGGDYAFRIRLIGPDGSEGEEQSVRFHIETVWYKTGWFYATVIAAISALLYGLYRYKLRQQLKVFTIRQRLHRDLHDDVGATLSSVKAYSEILGNNGNNEIISGLIKENAAAMLDRLEVISWATNPQYDSFKSLTDAMLKFARPLLHAHNVALGFEQENVNDDMPVPGDVRQHVLLIFKEAINNLVKYAEATRCDVCFATAHKQLVMKITDDGKGFDDSIRGGGAGIKNMRKRAEEMGGDLHIDAAPGGGTLVRLVLPQPFKIPTIRYRKGGQTT